jgi:hypothetical protein
MHGNMSSKCKPLMEKRYGKNSLGRPKHRWEDDFKIKLGKAGCASADFIKTN